MNIDLSLSLLAQLFDNLPLGVVVLDARGKVVIFNRTEETLAGRPRAHVLGRSFFDEIAPCMNVRQLAGEFNSRIGRSALDVTVEFELPFPFLDEPRDVRVKMSSFDVGTDPYAFLLIEDISKERSVQRMRETLQSLLVHDMKNPLSAVVANLGVLAEMKSVRDSRDAEEAIADSIESAERLQSMIGDLLDITLLENNTLPLNLSPVNVTELIASVVKDNYTAAKLRRAILSSDQTTTFPSVRIDPEIIRRALNNLVENAIRHSINVRVSAVVTGETLTLMVSDDGPGIPAEVRGDIFEKYVQAGAAPNSGYNRGLGLTFVRLAAKAHGGDAWVECPENGGTTFRISCALNRVRSIRPPVP